MIKIKLLSVGKTKEKWLSEAIEEYSKRLSAILQIESAWAKDDRQLIEWAHKEETILCLDPAGKLFTSRDFSALLSQKWEKGGSRLAFVIGGADGLPQELRTKEKLISLSPLTFTHQITRLVLIEQIYRATEIQRGSQYHK